MCYFTIVIPDSITYLGAGIIIAGAVILLLREAQLKQAANEGAAQQ